MKVPGVLPRFVPCPPENEGAARSFVWLEQVIAANMESLFPGLQVLESYPFRVTRDADLEIQEDEASDLLQTVEQGLRRRQFGDVARLEVTTAMPTRVRELLIENLLVDPVDVYALPGPLGLSDLMQDLEAGPARPQGLPADPGDPRSSRRSERLAPGCHWRAGLAAAPSLMIRSGRF